MSHSVAVPSGMEALRKVYNQAVQNRASRPASVAVAGVFIVVLPLGFWGGRDARLG